MIPSNAKNSVSIGIKIYLLATRAFIVSIERVGGQSRMIKS
ncbi:hypothetical protein BCO_0900007 [Borrelia coriaceae ATCC 43381]|uniref:Uncharacterized protein n=1 Tax=Borrelia coriaceae ATCC 43381 TaxID=1408429 RepID=W5SV98_9SPIR|nr:hypothetical protein BCO_0900007 [Borrelia coriaceae ATCC 43381]